jgi:hypothetical protein
MEDDEDLANSIQAVVQRVNKELCLAELLFKCLYAVEE